MQNNTQFIILAGGKSERMGVDKGLLKYQQTFWILEQLNRISKTTISEVFIGLGYHYQHYFDSIPWFEDALSKSINFQGLNVKIVINKQPQFGAFSTLQTVLKKCNIQDEIIINHIDIPILNTVEFEKLLETQNVAVIPAFKVKKGHPIKLSNSFWRQLLTVNLKSEDARLDYQLKKLPAKNISFITVNDTSIIKNLNTKQDWISYLKE